MDPKETNGRKPLMNNFWLMKRMGPIIGCKWVFKVKTSSNEDTPCYKARLCAKGYAQEPDVDYKKIFSPVVRYESLRTLFGYCHAVPLGNWTI